jgi:PAS domain S-box-containing protein
MNREEILQESLEQLKLAPKTFLVTSHFSPYLVNIRVDLSGFHGSGGYQIGEQLYSNFMFSSPSSKFGSLRLSHKGILLVCVPLAFELLFVSLLIFLEMQAESAAAREARRKEILFRVGQVQLGSAETAKCFALYFVTKKPVWRQRVDECLDAGPKELAALKQAVAGNLRETAIVDEMEATAKTFNDLTRRFESFLTDSGDASLAERGWEWRREFTIATGKFENLVRELQAEVEKSGKEKSSSTLYSRAVLLAVLIMGLIFNIVVCVILALFFSKSITQRVALIVDNANRMVAGNALNAPQTGKDEIAQLDRVFHNMAASLTEASRKERAIFENAIDVICKIDKSGKFADSNRAAEILWQYSHDELLGRKLVDIIDENSKESVLNVLKELRSSGASNPLEWKIITKSGAPVEMLWSIYWSEAEQSYFCVAHDVSERKQIERLKQDFLNMVSHDLRTPLLSFQMFLDLLLSNKAGQPTDRLLDMAQKLRVAMRTLTSLITDLLDLERMESGKLVLRLAPVPLKEVAEEAENTVRSIAEVQQVEVKLSDSLNATVRADRDRVCRVLVNLLSNALKFSPPRSTVSIAALVKGQFLEVTVRDQGPGIPADFKEKIFERFSQADESPRARSSGAGLGLAICKEIVQLHGGDIGFESNGKKGTAFWFTLPIEKAASEGLSG